MNNETKYGNEVVWCFIRDDFKATEIAIWKNDGNGVPYIIGRAIDKYEAKLIVDALLAFKPDFLSLGKKEIRFLEFVKSSCSEPYATMASNALMWNDRETYKKLLSDFAVVYS